MGKKEEISAYILAESNKHTKELMIETPDEEKVIRKCKKIIEEHKEWLKRKKEDR